MRIAFLETTGAVVRDCLGEVAQKQPITRLPMLSAEDRVPDIVARYPAMDSNLSATPIRSGVNETFRVFDMAGVEHVLKVYRAGWRTLGQVEGETVALRYLAARGVACGEPVVDRDGALAGQIAASEGERCYAMYRAVPGEIPSLDGPTARHFGRTAARFHDAAAGFAPAGLDRALDLGYLIDKPVEALSSVLGYHDEWRYLHSLARRLRGELDAAAPALSWGFCHGDLHGGNARIDKDVLALFDFEFCAPGYHAYDIAVYRWVLEIHAADRADSLWDAFLTSYGETRALTEPDHAAIGRFVLVRHLWDLAVEAQLSASTGEGVFAPDTLDRYLSHFSLWDARL